MCERCQHVKDVMSKLTSRSEETLPGLVDAQACERLLGYCKAMLLRDKLSEQDRAACERYLKLDRTLTGAEAGRISAMRRLHSKRRRDKKTGHIKESIEM